MFRIAPLRFVTAPWTNTSRFRTFEDARTFMHTCELKSTAAWQAWCRQRLRPPYIPRHPREVYLGKGWNGFPDWLGYDRQRKCAPTAALSPPNTRIAAAVCAKKIFLGRASHIQHFEALPYCSTAHLIFRSSSDADWCPLSLRSKDKFRSNERFLFIEKSGLDLGLHSFFVLRSTGKLYFFPPDYLAERDHRRVPKHNGRELDDAENDRGHRTRVSCYKIPRDEMAAYELGDDQDIMNALQTYTNGTPLVKEADLVRFFRSPGGALWFNLSQQAAFFRRSQCGFDFRRPSSEFLNAHFVFNKTCPVWTRCCVQFEGFVSAWRTDLGHWHEATANEVEGLRGGPMFILALIRSGLPDYHASEQKLRGFFLLPRVYLQKSGILSVCGKPLSGRAFYVYPTGEKVTRLDGRRTQREQEEFYIDLSCNYEGVPEAMMKARRIFEKYSRHAVE